MKIGLIILMIGIIVIISGVVLINMNKENDKTDYDGKALSVKTDRVNYLSNAIPNFNENNITNRIWTYEVTYQDELNITIEHLTSNQSGEYFRGWIDSYNDTRTNQGGYKFKIVLNYTFSNGTEFSEVKRVNLNNNDLQKWYYYNLPPNINNFRLAFGESSTLIDGTSSTFVLNPTSSQNICALYNGTSGKLDYHQVMIESDLDLHYLRNNGAATELLAGSYGDAGIMCDTLTNTLYIYYTNQTTFYTLEIISSTDNGTTWSTSSTKMATLTQTISNELSMPSCVFDNDMNIHCCAINTTSTNSGLFYFNQTIWGGIGGEPTVVSTNVTDDVDNCDIIVDQNDCIHIVGQGSNLDDIYIWSSCLDGWGYNNKQKIYPATVADGGGNGPTIALDYDGNMYISFISAGDVFFIQRSYRNTWLWKNSRAEAVGTLDNSDIYVTANNDIGIIYPSSGSMFVLNSTDGSKGENFLSVAIDAAGTTDEDATVSYQRWPENIKITNDVWYMFWDSDLSNDLYGDNFSTNYQVDQLINIIRPTTSLPVTVSSGSNFTVGFNFHKDRVNYSSKVNIVNITINGTSAIFYPKNSNDTSHLNYEFNYSHEGSNLVALGCTDYTAFTPNNPPNTIEQQCDVAITDFSYDDGLDVSDNAKTTLSCSTNPCWYLYTVTLEDDYIDMMNVSIESDTTATGITKFWAFNFSANSWYEFASTSSTNDVTMVFNATDEKMSSDFINNTRKGKKAYFLVTENATASNTFSHDYSNVKLRVKNKAATAYFNGTHFEINVTSPNLPMGTYNLNLTINITDSYRSWSQVSSQSIIYAAASSTPFFYNPLNSSTYYRYENFTANITINDSIGLTNAWFSTNASGTWINNSPVALGSVKTYVFNNSANISSHGGRIFCWKVYANSTTNIINQSTEYCFDLTTNCKCPEGVANWEVRGSDYCTLTSDCNMKQNYFMCSGVGWFKHQGGSILNFTNAIYQQGCEADCTLGQGCFGIA